MTKITLDTLAREVYEARLYWLAAQGRTADTEAEEWSIGDTEQRLIDRYIAARALTHLEPLLRAAVPDTESE